MGDFDVKTWSDAARTYERLRSSFWLLHNSYVVIALGLFLGFFYASAKNWPALAFTLLMLFIPVSCVLGAGMLFTWFGLRDFRCPRCSERFVWTWWNRWPTNRCKHCKLDLGAMAKDVGKSPALGELWE